MAVGQSPDVDPAFTWNGAVGLTPEVSTLVTVANLVEGPFPRLPSAPLPRAALAPTANTVTAWTDAPSGPSGRSSKS